MKSNLAKIFRIQKFLDGIKYPDSYRIGREISKYLTKNKRAKEEKILRRLHDNEPWEYIRGDCEFCENTFKVTKDTLIPRIETEQLVYECRDIVQKEQIKNIIDVGTGTGCIIISLASLLKKTTYSFFATDISTNTLNVAKKNELDILKKKRVKWMKSNLISRIPELKESTLLVANLPYIPTKQYEELDTSVRRYEPRAALDGGKDGLKYYQELLEQLKVKKINIKVIYLETEESIFQQTEKLIKRYYPKSNILEIKDVFERDRFLKITL